MKDSRYLVSLILLAFACSERPVNPGVAYKSDTHAEDSSDLSQDDSDATNQNSSNTEQDDGDASQQDPTDSVEQEPTTPTPTPTTPVPEPDPEPVKFKALTFNVYTAKADEIAKSVKSVDPDLACIQEASVTETKDAAKLLGDGWVAVTLPDNYGKNSEYSFLSKLPLVKSLGQTDVGRGVLGAVFKIGNTEAAFFCHHGPYQDFGPRNYYAKKVSLDEAIQQEKTNREATMKAVLKFVEPSKSANMPVFIMGDFNTASHEDYLPVINWPITKMIREAGYADSWREVNKDVPSKKLGEHLKTDPGITWYRLVREKVDFYTRMDFIFYAGPASALESKTVDLSPSDHFSLYTVFSVQQKK